ncbi:XRE family transcriptional regulator [Paenibacillaceae bacterium]|nr:XRE family transcriptional regulator [Paenibacillaceae bacterium]
MTQKYDKAYWRLQRRIKEIPLTGELADYVESTYNHISQWEKIESHSMQEDKIERYIAFIESYPVHPNGGIITTKKIPVSWQSNRKNRIKSVLIRNFKEYRLKNNYSQIELAEVLNVTQPTIARFDNEGHALQFKYLEKLVELLKIDHEDLEFIYYK